MMPPTFLLNVIYNKWLIGTAVPQYTSFGRIVTGLSCPWSYHGLAMSAEITRSLHMKRPTC